MKNIFTNLLKLLILNVIIYNVLVCNSKIIFKKYKYTNKGEKNDRFFI
jgi:hypothetical protein